jgi:hypothetical protein
MMTPFKQLQARLCFDRRDTDDRGKVFGYIPKPLLALLSCIFELDLERARLPG